MDFFYLTRRAGRNRWVMSPRLSNDRFFDYFDVFMRLEHFKKNYHSLDSVWRLKRYLFYTMDFVQVEIQPFSCFHVEEIIKMS